MIMTFEPLDIYQYGRRAAIAILVFAVLIQLIVDVHQNIPAIVTAAICTAILLTWYVTEGNVGIDDESAESQTYTLSQRSLLPGVIALELLFYKEFRHNVVVQVSATIVIAAAVEISGLVPTPTPITELDEWYAVSSIFRVEKDDIGYYFAWLALRAIVIVLTGSTAFTRWWYVSQLLIVLCALIALRLANLQKQNSDKEQEHSDNSVTGEGSSKANAGAAGARYLLLALATAAAVLYSMKNTIPWGISTILLTIPILLVTDSVVPATEDPEHSDPDKYYSAIRKSFSLLTLTCVAVAIVWKHEHSDPLEVGRVGVDTRCDTTQNLTPLTPYCTHKLLGNLQCCCASNSVPIQYKTGHLRTGCAPPSCAERIQAGYDCCGEKVTDKNIATLSGRYMCVNGMHPDVLL